MLFSPSSAGHSRSDFALVDEVADLCEDGVAQFDAEKPGAGGVVEVAFEALQDGGGQVGLLAKHAEQGCAVGGELVITRKAAGRLDGERKGDAACAGLWRAEGGGNQVDSHAGILPVVWKYAQWLDQGMRWTEWG